MPKVAFSLLWRILVWGNRSRLSTAILPIKLTLDKLASAAAMSRSAYASLFKQMVGLSPADYILQWRMAQAHRWLADDGISTLDAALRCGYESEASFSKAFKRVLGVGPGVARNMYSRIQ